MDSQMRQRGLVDTNEPAVRGGTAYLVILRAVEQQGGLCHGVLTNVSGEHCAIGSYFSLPKHCALETSLIDEVATVNDSVPKYTPLQRKRYVMRWLRWRLAELKMPGFDRWAQKTS